MDGQLIELLNSPLKKERQSAVEKALLLINEGKLSLDDLCSYFGVSNPDLTSSIIQILCRLNLDAAERCFHLYQALYEKHTNVFTEEALEKPNNAGLRLKNSFRKYFKDKKFFNLIVRKLEELHTVCYEMRKRILLEHMTELDLSIIRAHIGSPLEFKRLNDPLTEEEIHHAASIHLETVPNSGFSKFLGTKEKALMMFHHDLSVQFKDYLSIGLHSSKEKHLYDEHQLQTLKDDRYIERLVGLDHVYTAIKDYVFNRSEMLEQLEKNKVQQDESSRRQKPKKNKHTDIAKKWEVINQDIEWYKKIDIQKYYKHRNTKAMFKLLEFGDKKAFKLFYDVAKYYMIHHTEVHSSIDFYCHVFCEAAGINLKKSRYQMKIGLEWEELCHVIAKEKQLNMIKHPVLPNGSIPDMAVQENEADRYSQIIECKKSLYFAKDPYSYDIDINNNPTSNQYLPYCNELIYWILEDDQMDMVGRLHQKIKIKFANDFLEDQDLRLETKNAILQLQKKAKKKADDDDEHMDVIEWMDELKRLEEATYLKANQQSVLFYANVFGITPSNRLQEKVSQLPDYDSIAEVNKYISSRHAKCSEDIERFIDDIIKVKIQ